MFMPLNAAASWRWLGGVLPTPNQRRRHTLTVVQRAKSSANDRVGATMDVSIPRVGHELLNASSKSEELGRIWARQGRVSKHMLYIWTSRTTCTSSPARRKLTGGEI
ncbi:unnamed protein product [Cercospora beticola]|nr:unnamed protein product [Cercospora beticola]